MATERSSVFGDRYIPFRRTLSNDFARKTYSKSNKEDKSTICSEYQRLISNQMKRSLIFSQKRGDTSEIESLSKNKNDLTIEQVKQKIKQKPILKILRPTKIIEAPYVRNNFYLSLMDWSSKQMLVVGLAQRCFINDKNDEILQLNIQDHGWMVQEISCVKFQSDGDLLYVGLDDGTLKIMDMQKLKLLRSKRIHQNRIGSIENTQKWGLLTGSKDQSMSYHDLRCQNTTVLTFDKIKSEVCGITFKNNFVACGLNNGKIHLWDIRKTSLLKRVYHHTGAVKAIKWCPWKTNLLVSGGGNNDHKVVFWNFETEKIVNECDLKSQITSIGFRESSEEILTSHAGSQKGGYGLVWSMKNKQITHRLPGHTKRVLSLAINPCDDSMICSLSSDETIRFWNLQKSKDSHNRIGNRNSQYVTNQFKLK